MSQNPRGERWSPGEVASYFAVAGGVVGVLSFLERRPSVLTWRITQSLRRSPLSSTPNGDFGDLNAIRRQGQRVFSRPTLQKQLVHRIDQARQVEDICFISGGPGGIGKSVFWQDLLEQRPLRGEGNSSSGVWSGKEGPTRVVNLLKCKDLASFENKVVEVFHPKPFLPNFALAPPPTFDSTLMLLENALKSLPEDAWLILHLEDINRLAGWPKWQDAAIQLFTSVGHGRKGIVVGNSSVVLAYTKFEALPHAGLRTSSFFLPSMPINAPELHEYAKNGGYLYQLGFADKPISPEDRAYLIPVWNGNLCMLRKGIEQDQSNVRIRIEESMTLCQLPPKHKDFLIDEDPKVLELRAELLQLIADAPDNQIPRSHLSMEMESLKIAQHLAARDLITFRTLHNKALGVDYEVIAPYHPVVVTQFNKYNRAKHSAAATTDSS